MLEKIKEMMNTFAYVVTGVLFACALFITVFYRDDSLSIALLWQILGTAFICVWGNLLYPNRKISKKQIILRRGLHYLYINVVVFGCAVLFDWFDVRNWKQSGFLFISIAVIFTAVSWAVWHRDKKISQVLNERLKRYQDRKGEFLG
ncbi:MAG: DUF3021 domain-containing protein [Blautia sp.]|nr:DUF3021 domain-containing protein [Lachnoclostridium sp.]MCM1210631.1 DUF3021 domain-containing protein [Blautia sp.]